MKNLGLSFGWPVYGEGHCGACAGFRIGSMGARELIQAGTGVPLANRFASSEALLRNGRAKSACYLFSIVSRRARFNNSQCLDWPDSGASFETPTPMWVMAGINATTEKIALCPIGTPVDAT